MAGLDGANASRNGSDSPLDLHPFNITDINGQPTTKAKSAPPAEMGLTSAQAAQPNGRHAVGQPTGTGGRSHIYGDGVSGTNFGQAAPPPASKLDWTTNVANDPEHVQARADREAQEAADKAAAANGGKPKSTDDTNGHAVQAGTEMAQILDQRGLGPTAGRDGNIVAGALAGAVSRSVIAPGLLSLAYKVEGTQAVHPDSWTYRTAHSYIVKFDKRSNLERQLNEGLDPREAIAPSAKKKGETSEAYAARLKEEEKLIGRGVRPAATDLKEEVATLAENARRGIGLKNPEDYGGEVANNSAKARFLENYLKAPPGTHQQELQAFVRRIAINAPGGLSEADNKLLQDMAVAVDKQAQLTARVSKVAESIPMQVIKGAVKGGAAVAMIDTFNYYADVFAHHEGSKMGAHPEVTTLMGAVIPQAFFYGGIIKGPAEDATRWERFKNIGKKSGAATLVGLAGIIGLNALDHAVPGLRHSEYSRIMTPTTGESMAEAATWVMPVAEEKTRWKMAAATWLTARSTNATWGESTLGAGVVMAGTAAIGMMRGKKIGEPLLIEAGIWGAGRALNVLGFAPHDRTGTNDESWAAIKTDSQKMTESSLRNAVTAVTDLAAVSPDAVSIYRKLIIGNKDTYPIAPDDKTPGNQIDFGKLIANDRTALVLSEAEGQSILDTGLTQARIKNIYPAYSSHGLFDGVMGFSPVIAPKEQADLTGQAMKDMLFASDMCDITEKNLKMAQMQQANGTDTMNGHHVTQADIDQMEDEKKKLDTMMRSMLRDGPDAKPHDIKAIVEGDYAFWNQSSYSLANFAKHDQHSYDHLLAALESEQVVNGKVIGKIPQTIPWLANQEKLGLNPEISKKYVAKLFRDAAMMHLGEAVYQFNGGSGDIEAAKITIAGTALPSHSPDAWKNVDSMIAMAAQYDPDNVDLKALEKERDSVVDRIRDKDKDQTWYNNTKNPFHIQKPPFIP